MKIAIVGVTGMVGRTLLNVLEERKFPYKDIYFVASKKSVGKKITYRSEPHFIISIEEIVEKKIDLAFFSAGTKISKKWAPILADKGCKVIDNSSCWRMSPKHKLIIPEINFYALSGKDMIIANPNCSTIQLLMILSPIHKKYNIERVVVSTYQSVTGTGARALQQLESEEKGLEKVECYPHQIYRNALPQCDDFEENGYTKEEMKLNNETRKILDKNISVTATAVRIPVVGGHSESVNITCSKPINLHELKNILDKEQGVTVIDNIKKNQYPMPIFSENKDEVFVGRIRKDFSLDKSVNLWVVSDNLRKGAATNSVQIGEHMIKAGYLK